MKDHIPIVRCWSKPFFNYRNRIKAIMLYPKENCPFCGEHHWYSWDQMRVINGDGSTSLTLFAYAYCNGSKILLRVRSSYRRRELVR